MAVKKVFVVLLFLLTTVPASAQEDSLGTRLPLHATFQFSKRWSATGWFISNIRTELPDNRSFFGGVGYKRGAWTLESMIWRQWSSAGNNVAADFRLTGQLSDRLSLYAEVAPFFTKRMFYEFIIVEYRTVGKLRLGGETENIHRAGRDSIGAGPRVSYPLFKRGGTSLVAAFAYQFRSNEPNVARLYLALHIAKKR